MNHTQNANIVSLKRSVSKQHGAHSCNSNTRNPDREPKPNLYYTVRHSLGKKKTRGNHSVPVVTDFQILEGKSVYCRLYKDFFRALMSSLGLSQCFMETRLILTSQQP